MPQTSDEIWSAAEQALEGGEDPFSVMHHVLTGYRDLIRDRPGEVTLQLEAAFAMALFREWLRAGALALLDGVRTAEPANDLAGWLARALQDERTLATRACYWEAGQAVAAYLHGRRLHLAAVEPHGVGWRRNWRDAPECSSASAVLYSPPRDAGSSPRALFAEFMAAESPVRRRRLLEERLVPWLFALPGLCSAGTIFAPEAVDAMTDLFAPFRALEGTRRMPGEFAAEARVRLDVMCLLAGGEAERLHAGGRRNFSYGDALEVAAAIPAWRREKGLSWAVSRAEAVVRNHWPAVEALAEALAAGREPDGPAAESIIEQALQPSAKPSP